MKSWVLFCVAVYLLSLSTFAQKASFFSQDIRKRLDFIATQDVPVGAPGIATGIVANGEIVYLKYAGYANLEDSSQISDQTRFNIASNGKQFTALAILCLAAEKKLQLSDDIRKFFPSMYTNILQPVTIENLLNHSSGIRDVYDLWSLQGITWWKNTFANRDVVELLLKQQELNFEPGTKHLYSNSNYMLLAEIVGKVSGQSFVAYTSSLFRKLNMPNTSFVDDYTKIKGPIAKPYFNFNTWSPYNWIWNAQGDGNLFSTIEDQLQWEKIIQLPQTAGIPAELVAKSQQVTANPRITRYGYGLEFGEYQSQNSRFHEGATGAWKASFIRLPGKNFSIVTLTNSGKVIPSMQTRQMADLLLGIENKKVNHQLVPEREGSFVSIEAVLGTYQTENNFTFQFEKMDTSLVLLRSGRNDTRLVRESANVFHQWNDPSFKQEFTRNAKGEMQVTAYHTSHEPYSLLRTESDWNGFDEKSIEGVFLNSETNVSISIKQIAGKTYSVNFPGTDRNITAKLLTPSKLLANDYVIEFENEMRKPVSQLFLTSGRIQKIRFVSK